MKHTTLFRIAALTLMLCMALAAPASAWTEETHMAMALAAGYGRFHACGAPDVSHTLSYVNYMTQMDKMSHFANFPPDYEITTADVYDQLRQLGETGGSDYEDATEAEEDGSIGYALGAILRSARLARKKTAQSAYDEDYYIILMHYIADLANPLHASPYDEFNQNHHLYCDDVLTDKDAKYPVLAAIALSAELSIADAPTFTTEEELAEAIVTLAKQSQQLSNIMRAEDRPITREEALTQLSRAATLGNAILRYCGKIE